VDSVADSRAVFQMHWNSHTWGLYPQMYSVGNTLHLAVVPASGAVAVVAASGGSDAHLHMVLDDLDSDCCYHAVGGTAVVPCAPGPALLGVNVQQGTVQAAAAVVVDGMHAAH